MANGNNDNIDELISRHLVGETNNDEETALLLWINRSEQNKRHYFEIRKAFDLSSRHVSIPASDQLDIDVESEWETFSRRAHIKGNVVSLWSMRTWMRVAASLLLIMAATALVYLFLKSDKTVLATADETEIITLPDGSNVTLNRYTELAYSDDYGQKDRSVTLKGEAFFDVKADEQKPFIIRSGEARVRVVGTSFNVNAYDSMDIVEVIVETGIVAIEAGSSQQQRVDVRAGERAVIRKVDQQVTVATNEDVNFKAWSTRRLVFADAHLTSVIGALERTYNADIVLSAEVGSSCMVTVTFENQSLESVLKVLSNTLNLKYTMSGNKVEITEAGC